MIVFDRYGDYKSELDGYIDEFEDITPIMSRERRIGMISLLLDAYVMQTGEVPDHRQLYRLTDMILNEEITDRTRGQLDRAEHPFLSPTQEARRHAAETSLTWANERGVDGVDYRPPTRLNVKKLRDVGTHVRH